MQLLVLLNKFVKLARSISFKNPIKKWIVIFDNAGSNIIKTMILYDVDYTIFYARGEKYHITLSIMCQMIKNMGLVDWQYLKVNNQSKFRKFLKELYKVYCYSFMAYIKPKIVLTFVDNSYWFQIISRIYNQNAVFYAIQNGCRRKYSVTEWLPKAPDPGSIIFIPNFFCFGNYEKDLYEKYHHNIGCYLPVGSVRGSYYKNTLALKEIEIKYDICLVSEWEDLIMEQGFYPEIKNAILILREYLKKYIEEYHLSFCVATRSNDRTEMNYYRSYFGEKAEIIDFNMEEMSTYHTMDESSVIVTFMSTAAVEAFGWGKKVLFANFSGDDNYDLPQQGIWTINVIDYNVFKLKLNYLIKINEKTYREKTRQCAQYLMNYNPQLPTHILIRNMILKELHGSNSMKLKENESNNMI